MTTTELLTRDDDGVYFVISVDALDGSETITAGIDFPRDGDWSILEAKDRDGNDLDRMDRAALRILAAFALPVIQAGVGFLFPGVA